jgi:uncharacterized protein YmfQ (DUF2313 family)
MKNRTVFVAVTVANEFNGTVTLVKVEKIFSSAKDAQDYMTKEKKNWRENITINNSSIDCICERGIQETIFEDKESKDE